MAIAIDVRSRREAAKDSLMRFHVDVRRDCGSYRGYGVAGNSSVLRAVWLVMMCASCQVSEAPEDEARTSSSQPVSVPVRSVFESAIAVRDEATTVLIGRLAKGAALPQLLKVEFDDLNGDVLETVGMAAVQGSSGLVYASPIAPPGDALQNAQVASSAKVIVGSVAKPIALGQAEGTISEFKEGYWEAGFGGYSGCPHCLVYFLCNCLQTLEDVTLDHGYSLCPVRDEVQYPCEPVTQLQPTPR